MMVRALAEVSQQRSRELLDVNKKFDAIDINDLDAAFRTALEMIESLRTSTCAFADWSSAMLDFNAEHIQSQNAYIRELELQCSRFSTLTQGKANQSNSN